MRGTSVGDRQEMEGQHPERAFYASTRRLSAWCPRWAHHLLVILTESSPILQPLVYIEKPVVVCPSGEKVPHQDLLQDTVKGRLGIEEEGEDGKVGDIKRVLDCLCEEEGSELVRASFSLKLVNSLLIIPAING